VPIFLTDWFPRRSKAKATRGRNSHRSKKAELIEFDSSDRPCEEQSDVASSLNLMKVF